METLSTHKIVHVRKERLTPIHLVELNLDFESEAVAQERSGPVEHVKFSALHVKLHESDRLQVLPPGPFIQTHRLHGRLANAAHDRGAGIAICEIGIRRVERGTGRLPGDVESPSTSLGAERQRNEPAA